MCVSVCAAAVHMCACACVPSPREEYECVSLFKTPQFAIDLHSLLNIRQGYAYVCR